MVESIDEVRESAYAKASLPRGSSTEKSVCGVVCSPGVQAPSHMPERRFLFTFTFIESTCSRART